MSFKLSTFPLKSYPRVLASRELKSRIRPLWSGRTTQSMIKAAVCSICLWPLTEPWLTGNKVLSRSRSSRCQVSTDSFGSQPQIHFWGTNCADFCFAKNDQTVNKLFFLVMMRHDDEIWRHSEIELMQCLTSSAGAAYLWIPFGRMKGMTKNCVQRLYKMRAGQAEKMKRLDLLGTFFEMLGLSPKVFLNITWLVLAESSGTEKRRLSAKGTHVQQLTPAEWSWISGFRGVEEKFMWSGTHERGGFAHQSVMHLDTKTCI